MQASETQISLRRDTGGVRTSGASQRLVRRTGLALCALGLSALSCNVGVAPAPTASAEDALPRVAAAPPVAEAYRAAPRDPQVDAHPHQLAKRRTGLAEFETDALAETIVREAKRNDLTPALVLAVMHVESRFYNFAVSPVGALGLMQVMPATGEEVADWLDIRWKGQQTLFDPYVNVAIGAAYLRWLLDRYDENLPAALAAYNWGPRNVSARLRRGAPLPTEYSGLVMDAYARRGIGRS